MHACEGCGAETSRSLTIFDKHGLPATEECPTCQPGKFTGPVGTPADNKVWMGQQVYPHLYTRDNDGMYHAKDELVADTVALMESDPDAERTAGAIESKRRNRRTAPMTQVEIEQFERKFKAEALPNL